jgi:hypothetical protein
MTGFSGKVGNTESFGRVTKIRVTVLFPYMETRNFGEKMQSRAVEM